MGKKRIAVLGGGMSSLVTAYELTRLPEQRLRHEVTVYQQGHRLGGKGASGIARDRDGRIEEHGLHVAWGFYHNVFRVLRECYVELGRPADAPLARLEDALMPQHVISLAERDGDRLAPWQLFCPPNADRPGDERSLDDPGLYLERVLDWYAMLIARMSRRSQDAIAEDWPTEIGDALAVGEPSTLRALVRRLGDRSGALPVAAATAVVRRALAILPRGDRESRLSIVRLIDRLPRWVHGSGDAEMRQLRILADLAIATVRGVVADELLLPEPRFFEADDEDLRDWLRRHGAHEDSVTSSLISGLYHAAFAGAQPVGAGTLVHAFLRMVTTYQGAVIYRFRAGMGDVVFAPLYEVLRRRGVRFRFFHRVRALSLSADRRRIARVVIERQATVRNGEYEPLIDVGGLPCWPREALVEQLVEGDAIRDGGHDLESGWTAWRGPETITLEDGLDHDEVVLGISLGALPEVARELIDDVSNPAFRVMTERVRTIQTQAAQLWLDRDLAGLGWPRGNDRHLPIHIPFDAPFDTWCDMSYLLPLERWPEAHAPKHLAYLCSHLDDVEPLAPEHDTGYPARQRARVRENVLGWLRRSGGTLWPGAAQEGRFDFERLVDPHGRAGEARLDAQHWCAVENASDRYVLSVPGSIRARLRAHESGYENLVLTGDWTKTAFSIGCLEAATMSGFAAARAIDRSARRASGDWLPEAGPRRIAADAVQLPAYVSNGQLLAIPPLRMKTQLAMFLLDADLTKLQALVDRTLNVPGSPTHYRVVAPNVVLYCSSAETAPIDDPIGWCPEKDFGFWVPVIARAPDGSERYVVMTPWLWVDSGIAAMGGREVYGFPKELGRLAWPEDWKRPAELSIDTHVLPRYAPGERVVERRLATVRRAGGGVLSRARTVAKGGIRLARSLDAILEHGASGSYLGFTRSVLERRELRMAFLKQFPDVAEPTRACYRAITEAPIRIVDDLRFGLIDADYEIEIASFASHPIVDALGLDARERTTERSVIAPVGSLWLEFEARVERGEVVFEEAARRPATAREQHRPASSYAALSAE